MEKHRKKSSLHEVELLVLESEREGGKGRRRNALPIELATPVAGRDNGRRGGAGQCP